nr:MAG TPA: hypothetical protein [Caudoviricetes sp.]
MHGCAINPSGPDFGQVWDHFCFIIAWFRQVFTPFLSISFNILTD